ncbi:MAG: cation:proton antiporter [Balneolaceae bacterium]
MDILFIASAFMLGTVFSRIKLPPLVGYLSAGVLLHVSGYEAGDTLHEIAHLGVLFLLFTVGLHLRIKNILRLEVLGVGGIHLLISTAIFVPISLYFGFDMTAAVLIAVMLGFSSTVLTAKNLEMRNELGAYHGRVAIGILILQDVVAIVLLAATGGSAPSPWGIALLALPVLRPVLIYMLERTAEEELRLLFGLLLAVGGGSLFDELGLSSELGALAAGMLLSGHSMADGLSEKMWGLKEVFLVGFFLEVGLTGLPTLADFDFVLMALLILPVKAGLFFFLFTLFKLRSRTAFIATISLTAYSEFTLIAGSVAAASGFIPESIVVAFALLVAISFALNAPLSIWEEQLWQRYEKWLLRFERDLRHPDQQTISLGSAEYLVIGMGRAGRAAYDRLKIKDEHVVGMDIDPASLEENLSEGRRVVYGDMQDPELWENLDTNRLKAIMLAIATEKTKLNATRLIRKNGFQGSIYALTIDEGEQYALKEAGATAVCLPITQAGTRLADMALTQPDQNQAISLKIDLEK